MKYTQQDLESMLDDFRGLPAETAWLEFKENMADPVRIAKYISALSNMAAYYGRNAGYLVWGVDDATHEIKGTDFDKDVVKAGTHQDQPLELWLRLVIKPQTSYEFFPFESDGKKIVILEVDAAYRQPVTYQGQGWARIGNALTEMSKDPKIAAAIYRTTGTDWSAETLPAAKVNDLDPAALTAAREMFADKHKDDVFAAEIPNWDDITFLNKAKLAIDGKLTRAAILLLGKSEKAHLLSPSVARLTWHLKDTDENTLDYKHFDCPLILAVDQILHRIRSITLREIPDGTLFPREINQYDTWVLREALHNCIAHQDYSQRASVVVTEYPDHVQFSNAGAFLPGTVEKVLYDKGRPRRYPNKQLAEAMVELKMIDTLGSGIRRMFVKQRDRYMPMPDYKIETDSVTVDVPGKVLDARYCSLLIKKTDLTFKEIVLLDRVQKGVRLEKDALAFLRKRGLVEGRVTNLMISAKIAAATNQRAEYIKTRAANDNNFRRMILDYLEQWKSASREDINKLLLDKLPKGMSVEQKYTKISALLTSLRQRGLIKNIGPSTRYPQWIPSFSTQDLNQFYEKKKEEYVTYWA